MKNGVAWYFVAALMVAAVACGGSAERRSPGATASAPGGSEAADAATGAQAGPLASERPSTALKKLLNRRDASTRQLSRRLTDLTPAHAAKPSTECPLRVVPGASLGPIELGYTFADLQALALPISSDSDPAAKENRRFVTIGSLHAALLHGKVIDIWTDGSAGPDCLSYRARPISRNSSSAALLRTFGPCTAGAQTIGGAYSRCLGGGVYIGASGSGAVMSLRVRPAGEDLTFDNLEEAFTRGPPPSRSETGY